MQPQEVEFLKRQALLEQQAATNGASAADEAADIYRRPIDQHGGRKYLRLIHPTDGVGEPIRVDVYEVIEAFGVTCPALQQATKKILCAGLRGKGSKIDDLHGVMDAMWRALELQKQREIETPPQG